MKQLETKFGPCRLKRSSRRRTLAISVLPDGTVEAVAPLNAPVDKIRTKVESRARWIRRQRRRFAELNVKCPPRRYCSGATHRYLGRQYRLKIVLGESQSVKLSGGTIRIIARRRAPAAVARLLDTWMRVRAKDQFAHRLEKWKEWCGRRGLSLPVFHLRTMARRWGSATKNGYLALNPELVRAPSSCIDYVIAHELCHLVHPNHDRAFKAELDRMFPDWQSVKLRLESFEL